MEAPMQKVLTTAMVAFLAGCGAGFAQVGVMPGMGATSPVGSPLGSTVANAPSGPGGIPLGATELNTGGESSLTGAASCSGAAATGSAMETGGLSSPFDG